MADVRFFLGAFLSLFLVGVVVALPGAALPHWREAFAVGKEVSWFFTSLLLGLLLGIRLAQGKRRHPLFPLALFLLALAPGFPWVVATAFLMGVAEGVMNVHGNSLVGDLYPERRVELLNRVNVGFGGGLHPPGPHPDALPGPPSPFGPHGPSGGPPGLWRPSGEEPGQGGGPGASALFAGRGPLHGPRGGLGHLELGVAGAPGPRHGHGWGPPLPLLAPPGPGEVVFGQAGGGKTPGRPTRPPPRGPSPPSPQPLPSHRPPLSPGRLLPGPPSFHFALVQARFGHRALGGLLYAGAAGSTLIPALFALLPLPGIPLGLLALALGLFLLLRGLGDG